MLVVGAGPAGMECAIVLAKRGFERVHLVDADDDIGGCLRWVTRLPGLGEWGRRDRLPARSSSSGCANLEFVPDTCIGAADVRDYGAELVVVATGARWSADGLIGITRAAIPGADADPPHVLTPEQVMVEGKRPPGEAGSA